ncbi:alpha/beta hydrolase [Archaeoglobus neptunius]|uniref:alpha/beta hydrolase n=1 Tax=Archaeoglobus neptunius TaxID=2798580 RepID=UPI0019293DEE|nr:alpha/beta hydrolase [Archaeoglobus neptunius]
MYLDKKIGRNYTRIAIEHVLIICHGLPYEPGSVIEKGYSDLAQFFALRGIPSLVFDFSGTGLSDGTFSLKLWVEDLINISHEFEKVSVLGYSMGGAVAVRAAVEMENLEKLVIAASPCCTELFDEKVLRMIYENARMKNLLRGAGSYENFKNLFLREFTEIEPKNWIGEVGEEKLIVHGRRDDIVPFENGLKLYDAAKEPKAFFEIEEGDHFLRQNAEVSGVIADWLLGKIKDKRIIL